ncbi:MAG: U32 family peptidase [Paeniclostridium sp.]
MHNDRYIYREELQQWGVPLHKRPKYTEDKDKIIETGVLSLKIEGRMKKLERSDVINIIEMLLTNIKLPKGKYTTETMEDLYVIFNRKFTKVLY